MENPVKNKKLPTKPAAQESNNDSGTLEDIEKGVGILEKLVNIFNSIFSKSKPKGKE